MRITAKRSFQKIRQKAHFRFLKRAQRNTAITDIVSNIGIMLEHSGKPLDCSCVRFIKYVCHYRKNH